MEKHFICEFITAGGRRDHPLPDSLCVEGTAMREVLLRELARRPDVSLCLSLDDRLPVPESWSQFRTWGKMPQSVATEREAWQRWADYLAEGDYFWPIAPESEGILHRLASLAETHSIRMLGAGSRAIAACADKQRLYHTLQGHGLPGIETRALRDEAPPSPHGWVVKPALGAGCEGCYRIPDRSGLEAFLARDMNLEGYVIQPWIPGDSISLSTLMLAGQARMLACNRQRIAIAGDGQFVLRGVDVNALAGQREALSHLANAIARLFPELAGFVGIDLILDGQQYRILEINPRLTSAIGGLSSILSTPITDLVQELFTSGRLPEVRHRP